MAGGLWRKSKAGPQHDELRWGRSLGIAAAVMASVIMIQHINQIERESCFDHMYREAIDIAAYIESKIATDREELELLAAVVARIPDLCAPELWQMLDSFEHIGMISDLLLLLPDDTILYDQGTRLDVS